MRKFIGLVLVLGVVLMNSACLEIIMSRLAAPYKVIDKETGEEMIAIFATALTNEYGKDRAAADAKYKGRLLKVTGTVGDIITDGKVKVKLSGDNGWRAVYCEFEENQRNALNLKKKSSITLIGIGDGIESRVNIKVRKCRVAY